MITKQNAYALFEPDVIDGIMQGAIKTSFVLSTFRRLPNMTSDKMKMRVLDSLPMAYWVDGDTNNGRKKLTKMAWDKKYITVAELAVIVPIKEEVLADADYDIWAEVQPRISEAIGKKIDEAVLLGVDRPKEFREDLLTSIKNAGSIVAQGGKTLYETINDAMVKVEESGYLPNAIVGGVDIRGKFRMMLDTTGQPITGTEIGSIARHYIDNGAWDKTKAQMIVGDFSQAVYSIRQDITYKVLDEAIIQDPSTGEILYNLAQEDMVALRVVFRMGWEIPNPINALAPNEETRFPFAMIEAPSTTFTTKTVTFTVQTGSSVNVADANIIVDGVKKKTNSSGKAVFELQAGKHTYVVYKDGFNFVENVVTVASSPVPVAVSLTPNS